MTQDTSTVEEIIKEATNRFLGWKLPEDFAPDCGIEFQKEFNVSYNANQGLPPCKHEPVGTNLFDAQQAKAMVRYILEDVVTSYGTSRYDEGVKAERERVMEILEKTKDRVDCNKPTCDTCKQSLARNAGLDRAIYLLSDNK